jgi:tRNA nucleotidyltransferase/poly(A) polymerase
MGYTVEARTQMQIANAREAEVEKHIPARALGDELKRISAEDSPTEIFKGLEEAGLLSLFSPAPLSKLNLPGLARYEKAIRVLPEDARWRAARLPTFFFCLNEKLTPKERQALIKATDMPKSDVDQWQKIEARARKLETALRALRVRKPSHVYHIVAAAAPEDVLFVLYHSALRPVQERLRNHFQKYVLTVQEIAPEEWAAIEPKPGSPKYAKARDEFIDEILNRKPKKPVEEEVPPPPPPIPDPTMGRRGR